MHVTEWLKNIEKYAKENVYKFLVGNKSDLTENRVIQTEEASKFAEEHNLPYIETSAKDGINIDELFDKSLDFEVCCTVYGWFSALYFALC